MIDWGEFYGVFQVPGMKIWSGFFLTGIFRRRDSAWRAQGLVPRTPMLLASLLALGSWPLGALAQEPDQLEEPPEQTIRIEVKEVQIP